MMRWITVFLLIALAAGTLHATAQPVTPPAATAPADDPALADILKATQQAKLRNEEVSANLTAVREVLDIGSISEEAGEMLRESRRRAPNPAELDRQVEKRERQLAGARLDRVRLLERRRMTSDFGEALHLTDEIDRSDKRLEALRDALAAERELARQANALVSLLDARLLWIGSAPPINAAWARSVASGSAWLASPSAWVVVGTTLFHRIAQSPLLSAFGALCIALALHSRHRLKNSLATIAASVGKFTEDSFALTLRALGVTFILALAIPLLLFSVGALLATQTTELFARAVGHGLLSAAATFFLLDFYRQMCRNQGLADVHFGWNQRARRTLLNNLLWLILIETPAAFIVTMTDFGGQELYRQSLGRLAFLIGSTALTVFVARVFRPASGVFSEIMPPTGWAWRTRRFWYGLLVLLPAGMTVAAASGYYYTAAEVQSRFFTTGALVLAGVVIYSLMTRWLVVIHRRVALRQARQRLAEQREARQRKNAGDTEKPATGEAVPELDTDTINVAAASEQTILLLRTLVVVGVLALLWALWKNLLPALNILDRVELTRPTLDSTGNVIVAAVTLGSLLLASLVIALTIVAARNLPGLLELVVLQRFAIDAGIRYAATTLTRYIVLAIGIFAISAVLNIEWAKAQWIIAALGVGLGFGLQEIVANFVSGLIILFERPVRVGDTVSVGAISGTVSRIQIRATTITDWDNKEVLVPNKSFIIEPVSNWTLSNAVTRLMIPIGVAYGSDPAAVREAIFRAIKSIPTVLKEPAASVFFVGFGDSSLNFEIRVFVGEPAKRLPTLHDLNSAIDAELAAANIEIPFPQRDIHIRQSDTDEAEPANEESSA